jgi:hypothetical protein
MATHTETKVSKMGTADIIEAHFGEMIPVKDFSIDRTYQRPAPDEATLDEMVRGWDPRKVGVVYASLRKDGKYYLVDGQTRWMAALEVEGEDYLLPTRVYIDISLEDEAELFDFFNRKRKRVKPLDTFRARIGYREPVAVALFELVNGIGRDIAPRALNPVNIECVYALEQVYTRLGREHLELVLMILDDAWTDTGFGHIEVKGMSAFIQRYPEADKARLRAILIGRGQLALRGAAQRYREISPGANAATAWGRTVLEFYNLRLAVKNQLPDWKRNPPNSSDTAKKRAKSQPRKGGKFTKKEGKKRA